MTTQIQTREINEAQKRNQEIENILKGQTNFGYINGFISPKETYGLAIGYRQREPNDSAIIVVNHEFPEYAFHCEKLIEFCRNRGLEYKETGITPEYIAQVREIGKRNIAIADRLEAQRK